MKVLLIGSTGMLGQALYSKIVEEKYKIVTVARTKSDYNIDLLYDWARLDKVIDKENPDIIINTAAITNLLECQQDPGKAYTINASIPGRIAEKCKITGAYFIQISTDHYFKSKERKMHDENEIVDLINEYARTKYAGEVFSLTYHNSLVIRTNIVGYRNLKNRPTFIEWVLKSLENDQMITGFEDFYTSSIDVYHFAEILLELINKRVNGLINVASSDVLSKYEFIYSLASLIGKKDYVQKGKMELLGNVPRANSLGLNTKKLKKILQSQKIPTSNQVIHKLVEKYKEGAYFEL